MASPSRLNVAQSRAVAHRAGPLLVLAGAGTGKTRVVTHRIAGLLRELGRGEQILGVTFTNRAASEMKERIRKLVRGKPKALTVSTFHSLGVRILREERLHLGLPTSFSIYDEGDQEALLRDVLRDLRVPDTRVRPRQVAWQIGLWKSAALSPDAAEASVTDSVEEMMALVYRRYEEALRARGSVDFDDLINRPLALFDEQEEIATRWGKRFRYILVDEYQDTSESQYRLLRHLAAGHGNLCVVGDDDQSIYGFRGADREKILRFERDFAGASVVTLTENYRSTASILAAANTLIRNNASRHDKQLVPHLGRGEPIGLYQAPDETEEARFVARRLQIETQARKSPWRSAAVLYRANAQSKTFEDALRQAKIPYRVIGGPSFYDRREIRDAVAYLRILVNPKDELSLRRIINTPSRGIGRSTVEKLTRRAIAQGSSLWEAILRTLGTGELQPEVEKSLAGFHALVERYARRAVEEREGAGPLLESLLDEIGYEAWLRMDEDDPLLAESRWNAVSSLVGTSGAGSAPVDDFLHDFALSSERENNDEGDRRDQVSLLTVHAAKGLEFQTVLMVGLEEGSFPHRRSVSDEEGELSEEALEEERRLFYVGVTRARERLIFTLALTRSRFGREQAREPSRFIEEVAKSGSLSRSWPELENPPDEEGRKGYMQDILRRLGHAEEA